MERGNQSLKLVDRYLGIPLIWALGRMVNRKRKLPTTIRRIGIVKGAAIGDTVLLSAIVQDIRRTYPQAELIFFAGKTCVETARYIPGISRVVFLPFVKPWKALNILRQFGTFDVLIDAGPWTRLEALYSRLIPAQYRIGFNSIRQFRHFGFDEAVEHSNQQHELENNRNLIRSFVPNPSALPTLTIPPTPRLKIILTENNLTRQFLIFHPWSGGYKRHYKEWRNENWVELADRLTQAGYRIAFSGAKADYGQTDRLVKDCLRRGVDVVSLAGKASLAEMMAIINRSAGVVSVNTGVIHIAAAIGVPVVALNGPVPSLRWGAISEHAVNINPPEPVYGYIHLGFEYPNNPPDCMGMITVEQVETALLLLLSARKVVSS